MNKSKSALRDPLIIGITFGILVAMAIFKFIDESRLMIDMIDINMSENLFKLLFAAFTGGLIGFERESKNRPAGLRTHALVSIGAVLVMIIPFGLAASNNAGLPFDVTRLGAQVISGIGFLGAGTIIRNGNSVKGLTTAASLWVAAIIGLTIGAGDYFISFAATATVIFVLKVFGTFEHRQTLKNRNMEFFILTKDLQTQIGSINKTVEKFHLKLRKIEVLGEQKDTDEIKIKVILNIPNQVKTETLIDEFDHVVKVINH
jgi:putative Mg2+ transporter-C (MgtC) family protein